MGPGSIVGVLFGGAALATLLLAGIPIGIIALFKCWPSSSYGKFYNMKENEIIQVDYFNIKEITTLKQSGKSFVDLHFKGEQSHFMKSIEQIFQSCEIINQSYELVGKIYESRSDKKRIKFDKKNC